jgi:hypothetical protein
VGSSQEFWNVCWGVLTPLTIVNIAGGHLLLLSVMVIEGRPSHDPVVELSLFYSLAKYTLIGSRRRIYRISELYKAKPADSAKR